MSDIEKIISLVDYDSPKKSDAIILLEGDGLNRCSEVINLYKMGFAEMIVFSGGVDNQGAGSFPFSLALPILKKENISENNIIYEDKSQNTREQAVNVIKMAGDKGWNKLILVASSYHQYRAYLTFIKAINQSGQDIIIYNAPAKNLPWFLETGWGKRFQLLEEEFIKIDKYTKLGHIATIEELIKYQTWKELQA